MIDSAGTVTSYPASPQSQSVDEGLQAGQMVGKVKQSNGKITDAHQQFHPPFQKGRSASIDKPQVITLQRVISSSSSHLISHNTRKEEEYFNAGEINRQLEAIPSVSSIQSVQIAGGPQKQLSGRGRGKSATKLLSENQTIIGGQRSKDKVKNIFQKALWSRGSSAVVPVQGIGSGGGTGLLSTAEKNLQQNIDRMLKYVKLKKQIQEMKRHMLKSSIGKRLAGLNVFRSTFGDITGIYSSDSKGSEDEEDTVCGIQLDGAMRKAFRFLTCFQMLPTIEPSSRLKLVWDLLLGVVLIVFFFFIPVHVAINESIHDLTSKMLGYILNICMGIDILLSMNTAYFEKGVTVINKKKIFVYYVKNYLWSDLLAQIPLLSSELGSQNTQTEKFFVLLFFIKMRSLTRIFRKLEESFHLSPRATNYLSLLKLILTILFFSHIFSCVWLFVGRAQLPNTFSWLNKINMDAYYFSTVTMITVGYGDINPQNNNERMVCVGTMLVSCIIFAYTINQIGIIFQDIFSQDRQMKEFFYIINDYMDTKNIGFSLQYKIREYLDFYWREQDQNKSELEKKIIDSLSDSLREQLMIEANRIVLKDSFVFHSNFSSAVVVKMIPIIQTIHTTPNQVIFSEGQSDEDMFIYFIEKGKVEVCREASQSDQQSQVKFHKTVAILGPGSSFGSYSFLTNLERREMARSIEFTKLLMIRRNDFLSLLEESPSDMERFHQIKDGIMFENNFEHMGIRCASCSSSNHEIQHCHFFHYQPDPYVIARRFNIYHNSQNRSLGYQRQQEMSKTLGECRITSLQVVQQCEKWRDEQKEVVNMYASQYLVNNLVYSSESLEDYEKEEDFDELEGDSHSQDSLSSSFSSSNSSCTSSINDSLISLNGNRLEDKSVPNKPIAERIEEVDDDDNSPQIKRYNQIPPDEQNAVPTPAPTPFIKLKGVIYSTSERTALQKETSPLHFVRNDSPPSPLEHAPLLTAANTQLAHNYDSLQIQTQAHNYRRSSARSLSKRRVANDHSSVLDLSPQLVSLDGKNTTAEEQQQSLQPVDIMQIMRLDVEQSSDYLTSAFTHVLQKLDSDSPPILSHPSKNHLFKQAHMRGTPRLKRHNHVQAGTPHFTSKEQEKAHIQRLGSAPTSSPTQRTSHQKRNAISFNSNNQGSGGGLLKKKSSLITSEDFPVSPNGRRSQKISPEGARSFTIIQSAFPPYLVQPTAFNNQQPPPQSTRKKSSSILQQPTLFSDKSPFNPLLLPQSPKKLFSIGGTATSVIDRSHSSDFSIQDSQQIHTRPGPGNINRKSISGVYTAAGVGRGKPFASGELNSPQSTMSLMHQDNLLWQAQQFRKIKMLPRYSPVLYRQSQIQPSAAVEDNRMQIVTRSVSKTVSSSPSPTVKNSSMPQVSSVRLRLLNSNLPGGAGGNSINNNVGGSSSALSPMVLKSLVMGESKSHRDSVTPQTNIKKLQRQQSITVGSHQFHYKDQKGISLELANNLHHLPLAQQAFNFSSNSQSNSGGGGGTPLLPRISVNSNTSDIHAHSENYILQQSVEYIDHEEMNLFLITDFDVMKVYQFYFPRFNYASVLQRQAEFMSAGILKFLRKIKKQRQIGSNAASRMLLSAARPNSSLVARKSTVLKKSIVSDSITTPKNGSSSPHQRSNLTKFSRNQSTSGVSPFGGNDLSLHSFDNPLEDRLQISEHRSYSQTNLNLILQSPKPILNKSIFNNMSNLQIIEEKSV